MPNYTPEDPALAAGQQQGYQLIEGNTRNSIGHVERLMGQYGTSNADYQGKMQRAQLGAEAAAKLRLDAHLAMSQLRSRMHEAKLKMLQDAYKQQAKDQRTAMWATALGSAAQVGSGVWGQLAQPADQQQQHGFYTDFKNDPGGEIKLR